MKKLIVIWMCLLLVGCSQETVNNEITQSTSAYYSVDEFLMMNPNQVQLMVRL